MLSDPFGLRSPTDAEAQFIPKYFGNCLDPNTLDIEVRTWGDTSRALSLGGGLISLPSSNFIGGSGSNELNLSDPLVASTYGHEAMHQVQRAAGKSVTARAIPLQIAYTVSTHSYVGTLQSIQSQQFD
jgi:hypothetical protein